MKTMSLRLTTFLAVALFTVGVTAQFEPPFVMDPGDGSGGAGGSCQVCRAWTYGSGYVQMACTPPYSGGWGNQNCRIESYPEGSYCFVDGNQCCVD